LSDDLCELPRELVECVVCHELVHLRLPGHGKGWQAMMGAYLPDWRAQALGGWVRHSGFVWEEPPFGDAE
jgi:predicted metal-dependent hydrolase